ncbi:MAG: hypothetical protein R3E77_11440 [Steroidobacteraceae bacterium]
MSDACASRKRRSLLRITMGTAAVAFTLAACDGNAGQASARVRVLPVPDNGTLADAAMDAAGRLHLAFLRNDDLYYTVSADLGRQFAPSLRINERKGFAAGGLFRGPKIAITADGRAHIVWYNRAYALGLDRTAWGVMYSQLGPGPEVATSYAYRGGADGYSITAFDNIVTVAWHDDRAVFVARRASGADEFAAPLELRSLACECCDTSLAMNADQVLWAVYRDREGNRRDEYLQRVDLQTGEQRRLRLDAESWIIDACPISGVGMALEAQRAVIAWEHDGAVLLAAVDLDAMQVTRRAALGAGKYPLVLVSGNSVLVAWKDRKLLRWSLLALDTFAQIEQGEAVTRTSDRTTGVATRDGHFILLR